MINPFAVIKTVVTIGKTLADAKKEIKNRIEPLEIYANEPNQNNIDIAKMKDDIILLKNKVKQFDSKANKKRDKKWYDE